MPNAPAHRPAYVTDDALQAFVQQALAEDLGPTHADHTTLATIPPDQQGRMELRVKETGTLAGMAFAQALYAGLDTPVHFSAHLADGDPVQPGDIAFSVAGPQGLLLSTERVLLNVMQRMSGIATRTQAVLQALEGTGCQVLDTRKTTPLLRMLEKWAVRIGGGINHRYGLWDMILIKDNHVDACGGIKEVLAATAAYQQANSLALEVELEVRTLAELEQALAYHAQHGGLHRLLLDNMPPPLLRQAVERVGGALPTEASGGITLENARAYAETGVNFLSMGALTHSVKSLDLSLKTCG